MMLPALFMKLYRAMDSKRGSGKARVSERVGVESLVVVYLGSLFVRRTDSRLGLMSLPRDAGMELGDEREKANTVTQD